MCGIVGILSNTILKEIIYNCLIQLQNRGYDSCGIASIINNKFIINKFASDDNTMAFNKLYLFIKNHYNSNISISHTRWATHGAKTDVNSHPHLSFNNKICLVHNGIIENYKKIKNKLIEKGYEFKSDTDTEVIVNLLEYEYILSNNIMNAFKKTINQLKGTWSISFLLLEQPNKLFNTRNGSPLLIGINDNIAIVTSEQSGFNNKISDYFILNNNDICILTLKNNKINVYTENKYIYKKIIFNFENKLPSKYKHWTIKEINDQSESICIKNRLSLNNKVKLSGLNIIKNKLLKIKNIILLGCGTSFLAGLYSTHIFKELCNFNTINIIDGADFNINDVPKIGKTACILLSQSGETKDLHRCIDICNKNNIITIGVVNVRDSMIAREVDCVCYLNAGKEIAVASTKSFTSQIIVLSLIAIWFSQNNNINNINNINYINDLRKLNIDIENTIKISNNIIPNILNCFNNKNSCFILGKGKCEAIAKEGALKIKEITYIHAEGYSTSSLKHGPFALLEKDFPVIMLGPIDENYTKVMNAYEEIKTRGSKIIFITDKNIELNDNNHLIKIPHNNTFNSLLCIIPIQLLAYYISIKKGINPDMPKNLAKVVTVE